ncbi:MAG: DNA recombination protein RmuC, partial [Bacteroidales bacterium]
MQFIFLIIGLVLGSVSAWFASKFIGARQRNEYQQQWNDLEKAMTEQINLLDKEKSILAEKNTDLRLNSETQSQELVSERIKNEELNTRLAKAEVEYKNLREKLETQKAELEEIQKKFTMEFENIASKILKQNSSEFTLSNQKNISEILNPLKERIKEFENKVENTYQKGIKDQTDLKAELKKLYELNFRISEEANNLTRALKSDTKKQGNWGEVILERVLERSGLVKGQEYETQTSTRNEDGDLIRPDIVVKL